MTRGRRLLDLARYQGPRWLAYRSWYAVRRHSGLLRAALPAHGWDDLPLSKLVRSKELAEPERLFEDWQKQASPGLPDVRQQPLAGSLFSSWDGASHQPVEEARAIGSGCLPFFGRRPVQSGFPPDWHRDPQSGETFPSAEHWSRIGDFAGGDIKAVWELNRFGAVYPLMRAYGRTGNEQFAEWFWQLVDDWRRHNPPQQGVNWKCGQEISFRVMAWCFGLWAFRGSPATSPDRVAGLVQAIAVSGLRIERNIGYALSQNNNHGISEAAGLWTIGTLFPGLRPAARWRTRGRQLLEKLARELIYPDGGFSQQSFNYQRVMLDDYLWCLAWDRLREQTFSSELKEQVARSADFLYDLQDASTGRLPNYGANDGAHLLPLTNCCFADFRPEIQAATFLTSGRRAYAAGPWDELLLWLCGPEAFAAPTRERPRQDLAAEESGYYTLRSSTGFAFVRSPRFRHRPGHADLLHFDLWWRDQNIALDAGTYSYNREVPWDASLAATEQHNTVMIGELDHMQRASRFLWLPWPKSTVRCRATSPSKVLTYWEAEHDGYARRLGRGTRHIRGILRLGDEDWLVIDYVHCQEPQSLRLHWLLADLPCELDPAAHRVQLNTPSGEYHVQLATTLDAPSFSAVRGEENSARGWRSDVYGSKVPTWSVVLEGAAREAWFVSKFGPERAEIVLAQGTLVITSDAWQASLQRSETPLTAPTLLSSISVDGVTGFLGPSRTDALLL